MLSNLANLADLAEGALVLGVVLGPVKRTLLVRRSAVNRGVAGSANLKLGELIKFNINSVVGVTLALSLGSLGLFL